MTAPKFRVRRMEPRDLDSSIALAVNAFGEGADSARRDFLRRALRASYEAADIMRIEHGYVAELEGRVVARSQVLQVPLRFGCVVLRVAGVHAIAADPQIVGRSLMLPMVRFGLEHVRKEGFELGLGFTQHPGVFALFGGVTVCADYEWRLSLPSSHSGANDSVGREFRPIQATDVPWLVSATNYVQRERVLSMVRSESIWHQLERQPPEVWRSEDAVVGLRWSAEGAEIRDFGTLASNEKWQAERVLDFVETLARQRGAQAIFGESPPDHPLTLAALARAASFTRSMTPGLGCMAGILDVSRFLKRVSPELERRLACRGVTLQVVASGEEQQILLGENPGAETVRVECSRAQLLQALLGTFSWRELHAEDSAFRCLGSPSTLDVLFAARHPYIGRCDRW